MIDVAWAQAGPGAGGPPVLVQMAPIVLLIVIFYFLTIRPQQQKQKEHRELLANLKKNDQVITSGGLYGRVMSLTDEVVSLEVAPNVRVTVARAQITTVLTAKPSGSGSAD